MSSCPRLPGQGSVIGAGGEGPLAARFRRSQVLPVRLSAIQVLAFESPPAPLPSSCLREHTLRRVTRQRR